MTSTMLPEDGKPGSVLALMLLAATLLVLALLLALPVILPIGPMYWDTYIYFDAINRIGDGQVPILDFFAPVGPVGYYLAAALNAVFPSSQPLLLVNWSMLLVTAPMMAIVTWDVGQRSRALALALLIPFIIFAVLPFNVVDFFPYPGVDGFGIYNRHGAHLLYVLAATVLFVESRWRMTAILTVLTLVLFMSKITAFISGGLILAFAFAAGRIALSTVLSTAALFLVALGALELATGLVSTYLYDVYLLATLNEDAILPRFLTVGSQRMDVILAAGLLCLALLILDLRTPRPASVPAGAPWWRTVNRLADRDWLWIGVLVTAGTFFETQNTGSQAFIMVWPGLLALLAKRGSWTMLGWSRRSQAIVLILIAATALPTFTKVMHKALRAAAVAPTYERVPGDHLGRYSLVSTKDRFMERAQRFQKLYPSIQDALGDIADTGELPSFLQFSEPDFQIIWLMTVNDAIEGILKREEETGKHYETIFMVDFANPFPFLMGRSAPKYVAIGADPYRAVPDISPEQRRAIVEADMILVPTCPVLGNRRELIKIYEDALANRERVALTDCFDMFTRKSPPQ